MESSASSSISTPRLKLSSHGYDSNISLQPGQSRFQDFTQLVDMDMPMSHLESDLDDYNDQHITPKANGDLGSSSTPSVETPAARLRALLARVPTGKGQASSTPPPPRTPSDFESDYETPDAVEATPSFARESLKDIFSRALRDPGDTPKKSGHRRNSIDGSEVDASPRVERERETNKGKRRSFSDEEVETPPKVSRKNTPHKRASQPITLDILRERYAQSRNMLNNELSTPSQREENHDTTTILRDLNSSRATPPAATSTPQQSLRMSTNFNLQFHSNLLEQDFEMRREMEALDSYDDDKSPIHASLSTDHVPFSIMRQSLSVSNSADIRRESFDSHHLKQQPSQSITNASHRNSNDTHDENSYTRERDWSKTKTPLRLSSPNLDYDRPHERSPISGSSNVSLVRRQASAASLQSLDALSPQASFAHSQSDYRQQINEMDTQRHPRPARSASSLGSNSPYSHERQRTNSSPKPRLHSAQSSPIYSKNSRSQDSRLSPRGTSPAILVTESRTEEIDTKVAKEQWKASRSNWTQNIVSTHTSNRSLSPAPRSPSPYLGATRGEISADIRSHSPSLSSNRHEISNSSVRPSYANQSSGVNHLGRRRPLSPFQADMEPNVHVQTSQRSSSPQPKPSMRSASHSRSIRPSKLPIWSPKKLHTSSGIRKHVEWSTSDVEIEPIDMRTGWVDDVRGNGDLVNEVETVSEERTPTLRTVTPPELPPKDIFKASRYLTSDETRLYHALASDTHMPIQVHSPPPSPPEVSVEVQRPSYLVSPPRHSSSSSSKTESKTPSPPKGLPAFPEPPPSSEEEGSEQEHTPQWSTQSITESNGNQLMSQIALKTPRPPGAWMSTPAPGENASDRERLHSLVQYPSDSINDVSVAKINLTAMKTPRPPGAWDVTSALERQHMVTHSVSPEPEEPMQLNGLATPAASLSKASTLALQTPSTSGRKSILKVRFDAHPPESPQSVLEESSDYPNKHSSISTTRPVGGFADQRARPSTPEPHTPVSPARSPRSARRSTTIRVLDEYGNEQPQENSKVDSSGATHAVQNSSSIRVVDAMGQEVKEEGIINESETPGPSRNFERREVLSRVRFGLDELVQSLDDMYKTTHETPDPRFRELDEVSRSARENRGRLSKGLKSTESNLLLQLESLQGSIKKNRLLMPIRYQTSSTKVFFLVLSLQLLFLLVMYRFTVMRAKELFLTTYYDPFYPDLHLYTFRPALTHYSSPSPSWLSLPSSLYLEGWKASSAKIRHNLITFLGEWQDYLWETWGSTGPSRSAWPPT